MSGDSSDERCAAMLETLKREGGLLVIGSNGPSPTGDFLYSLIRHGVSVTDTASLWEEIFCELPIESVSAVWFAGNLQNARSRRPFLTFKRALDIIAAIIIGILSAPLWPVIAAAIKLSGPGPILFSQVRLGLNGQPFTLYKFRTMGMDAEANGAQWATKNDPRATPVGRFLRHTHLDELPQIWNILKGEMSFIGPRPERPEFAAALEKSIPYYDLRYLVRPGITGWAQINYRYGSSTDDAKCKLAFDLYYVKNQSLFTELKVTLKTALMVFRGEGR
jgi:exopolysaccharide biosynthesis polyprenyl glycosylphosphotransferase